MAVSGGVLGACQAEPGVKASCGRHEARAVAVVGDPTRRVEVARSVSARRATFLGA